jgi:hypothetical protein
LWNAVHLKLGVGGDDVYQEIIVTVSSLSASDAARVADAVIEGVSDYLVSIDGPTRRLTRRPWVSRSVLTDSLRHP